MENKTYVTIFMDNISEYDFMVFECNSLDATKIVKENADYYIHTKKTTITSILINNIKDKIVYFRNAENSPSWYSKGFLNGYNRDEVIIKDSIKESADALLKVFPNSFINDNCEFIAHLRSNQYIILENCDTPFDVKCKVIEWFSRPAYKTAPYHQEWRNEKFHEFMLNGVNSFLGTSFTYDDMDLIYTYLGNACNHKKTIQFIESNYDMKLLTN